jgi:hypothetical protein
MTLNPDKTKMYGLTYYVRYSLMFVNSFPTTR